MEHGKAADEGGAEKRVDMMEGNSEWES